LVDTAGQIKQAKINYYQVKNGKLVKVENIEVDLEIPALKPKANIVLKDANGKVIKEIPVEVTIETPIKTTGKPQEKTKTETKTESKPQFKPQEGFVPYKI